MSAATKSGSSIWPDLIPNTYTYVPPIARATMNEEKYALARAAMQGLLTSDRGLILSQEEIVKEAWDMADKMMNEGMNRGVYL